MQHSPAFLALVEDAMKRVREVSVDDVRGRQQRGDAFVLVDVREDHEWQAGHIPEARHLGKGIIERDAEKTFPDPATPLVLYCGGGFRSALAADALQRMGYRDVRSMAGGFRAWCSGGHPTERE